MAIEFNGKKYELVDTGCGDSCKGCDLSNDCSCVPNSFPSFSDSCRFDYVFKEVKKC